MARFLILRDEAAALATAARVQQAGHEPALLPLQAILPLNPDRPAGPFAGAIVTSANAVPYLAAHRFCGPVLAVGEASAAALRAAAIEDVREGGGDAANLAEEVARLPPGPGKPLLYLAGRVRTPTLEDGLTARGIPVHVLEVYDTVSLDPSDEAIECVLGAAPVDAVLLLSAGQAAGFARLHRRAAGRLTPLPALLCLSRRIAEALPDDLLPAARVAVRPTVSDLLALYPAGGPR